MTVLTRVLTVVIVAGLLGSCAQPAKRGQADLLSLSPEPTTDEDKLQSLLLRGGGEPRCLEGAELQRARANHVEEEASRVARASGQRSQTGAWFLTPEGASDGQASLVAGRPIPDSILQHQGGDLLADWRTRLDALLKDGQEEWAPMEAGLIDQDGFGVLTLEQIDARVRLTHKYNVFGFYAGPRLRTREGTGLGSTLQELEAAHGPAFMTPVPEPYHCLVSFLSQGRVSFLFRGCQQACLGDGVLSIYVGGYDGPEEELPWGNHP